MKTVKTDSELFLELYNEKAMDVLTLVSLREEQGDKRKIAEAKDLMNLWEELRELALKGELD